MDFSHYIMHTIQHIIKYEQDIMTMMNQMFYSLPSDSFGVPYTAALVTFTLVTFTDHFSTRSVKNLIE